MTLTAGIDMGGAHLKIALAEGGRIVRVDHIVCPLWQGLDKLDAALAEAEPRLRDAARIGITMTGELSDLFPDRATGVVTLVERAVRAFGARAQFWRGLYGFGSHGDALADRASVGSTNFLATAALVASHVPDALLIDMGSTTTDIIAVAGGKVVSRGLTDAQRQSTGELVYTGFTRTAVMGVASRAPFQGRWVSLAREYLATMADVRRVLGDDLATVDLHATADGKGKSLAESTARFARMLGCDAAEGSLDDWQIAARYIVESQRQSIMDGALQVLSATRLAEAAPAIAAGTGAIEVIELARRLGRDAVPFGALLGLTDDLALAATHHAPAAAVAVLVE